ncbi:uncharacterized protein LOC142877141 [Nelusetta ayraudi]|uniref:uncharacterized protein LOC142877141 n=1 Tax=Nelusetta ayraudi TaxID=303726 RepID=UPI003F713346
MYMDSTLRYEIISSLFGQTVKRYDEGRHEASRHILSVDEFHLHNLTGKREARTRRPLIDDKDFFDPNFDYDFTFFSGSDGCSRGDEHYERPKGWYRIALKVKGKYPNGDAWLGPNGWRSHSAPGEWPVSYHGTSLDGSRGIIRSHYKAGNRAMYGRGIYSTPDIHIAESDQYAKIFTSESTGKSYKVILQNRINPAKRSICSRSDYWLIPVAEGVSAEEEKEIVESSIRPYGILIRELTSSEEEEEDVQEEEPVAGGDDSDDSSDNGDTTSNIFEGNDDDSTCVIL